MLQKSDMVRRGRDSVVNAYLDSINAYLDST
jgi:hypothetical protein